MESDELVRQFVQEYFDAWSGTDEDAILAYYSDDVVLQVLRVRLEGKIAVRDQFVRPFIAAFPGNLRIPQSMAFTVNLVAVEWIFQATHTGPFGGFAATGRKISIPGASFYEHDLEQEVITAARIYFDFDAFLKELA
jgi:steroid delta-isomerase-like uncharacterized protein